LSTSQAKVPEPDVEPVAATGVEEGVVVETDAELVRASVADPSRFEAIFDRHHTRIWRYLARVAGTAAADDLAADVFVAAFAARARYDAERGSVVTWLYAIATNRLRSRQRRYGREQRAVARVAGEALPPDDAEAAVDAAIDAKHDLVPVVVAFDGLAEADREILVLAAWEGLAYAEIASVLGIELGTVRSRLSRARGRLRERLGTSGEEHGDGATAAVLEAHDG
jgi:RNA polymerase sigma factor (sigma-70 family)